MTEALSKMNIDDAVAKMLTPNGDQLEVVSVANAALYALRFKKGGRLPDGEDVAGRFTKPAYAITAGQAYVRRFWDKVEKDSKPLSNKSRKERDSGGGEQDNQSSAE